MEKSKTSAEKSLKRGKGVFFNLANEILAGLPQRSQEILKKRFGLDTGKIETLEKIGSDYQITRERVRQIIADSIKKISKLSDAEAFKKAEDKIILEISKRDGIINEEHLFERLAAGDPKEEKAIIFFALCSNRIIEIEKENLVRKSWSLSMEVLDEVEKLAKVAKEVFSSHQSPLSDIEVIEKISRKHAEITKNQIISFLGVLHEISKNKFGKWGFSHWMEINPKGTRERIYLVLKEKNSPLHFTQIARSIDEFGIGKRKSHPQTVHNELIKDDRFVLIGRGTYALREWGYAPGTIKDVIREILTKSGKAMTKDEIMEEILKSRQVKKTTVMINLNNKAEFAKQDNKYMLKK
jgi:DNA-directed RNA polymerase delta subunit